MLDLSDLTPGTRISWIPDGGDRRVSYGTITRVTATRAYLRVTHHPVPVPRDDLWFDADEIHRLHIEPDESDHRRLERETQIAHCREPMRLIGNLSLRGAAGATSTRLAYECVKCWQRIQVVDDWGALDAADLAEIDATP